MARTSILALVSGLLLLAPPASAQGEPTMAVIAGKAKGGPNLKGKIKKMVEKPLKKEFNLLPFKKYKKAGKKVGVKGKAIFTRDAAVPVGSEAGATHVLFVEGQMEKQPGKKKRKKKVFFAEATLIDVATGDVVWTNRYQLKGKKITPQIASEIVEMTTQAASTPAEPPEPPADDPIDDPMDAPPPPDMPPPPDGGPMVDGDLPPDSPDAPPPPEGGEDPIVVASGDPVDGGMEDPPTDDPPADDPPPTDVMAAITPMGGDTSISISEPIQPRKRKRWRPALHAGAGAIYMWRTAEMTARDAQPPAYEGPLPGAFLKVDFYPLALGGDGGIAEGIGLHLEGQFHRVETITNEATDESVVSQVTAAGGGLSFRFVFWDSAIAPDFTLKGGYGFFFFPLDRGPFPGVRYAGPYAGGTFTIPFMEQFGMVLGGGYYPMISVSGKLKRLGELREKVKPSAFRGEGGFRVFIDPFEILLVGRFEQFDSRFRGTTNLEDSVNQYDNVKLRDRMFGGWLTAGVAF